MSVSGDVLRFPCADRSYSRSYSSPLRAGHKTAHLFTESTVYRYIEDLATPKKWFKANADHILAIYGAEHRISKEDLYVGTPSKPFPQLLVPLSYGSCV